MTLLGSPSAPKPTAAQLQEEGAQASASALLDQQENERRKRLLNAAAGLRAFSGSAIGRAAPSNTAAGAPSPLQVASSGSFVAPRAGGDPLGNFGGGRGGSAGTARA